MPTTPRGTAPLPGAGPHPSESTDRISALPDVHTDARGTPPIRARVVLHFPGFEPLTAAQHQDRYRRAAMLSARAWDLDLQIHALRHGPAGAFFDVDCRDAAGPVASRIHIYDHCAMVRRLTDRPLWRQLASGFASAARIAARGGAHRYFLSAWRFGLFFLYPFALIGAVLALSVGAVLLASPLGPLVQLVVAAAMGVAVVAVWYPLLQRLHVPLLLCNWRFALLMAGPLDRIHREWLEGLATAARGAIDRSSDEIVITAHSMGANIAVQVIGILLEREPDLFAGRRVTFVTLGGAVLQCALIRGATTLRARVGRIARAPDLHWIDVQCLIDPVSFYHSKVVAEAGHADARPARVLVMRIRKMVSTERYRKMRGNFLRIHRQYVLGSDTRNVFDYTYLTAGPQSAAAAGRWGEPKASPPSTAQASG